MLDQAKMPSRMAKLPRDARGYPVPRFVSWYDGKPDFRIADTRYLEHCFRARTCWLCGELLGRYLAFVIGPMCAVNRTTAEPPCHRDCAEYAVQACPFLCFPQRTRDMANLPERRAPPGSTIERNPGVALIWVTLGYTLERDSHGRPGLISIGDPVSRSWWCRGRPATRAEVEASIESGLPLLHKLAEQDGPEGIAELDAAIRNTMASLNGDTWPVC